MKAPSILLARLLVGAFAGVIVGALVATFAVSYFPERDLSQSLAEHENAERRFRLTVLSITAALVTLLAVFAGNLQLRARTRTIMIGVLTGVACAVIAAHVAAYARDEWPFRGKAPQTAVTWGRNVGVPVLGLFGGLIANYVYRPSPPKRRYAT